MAGRGRGSVLLEKYLKEQKEKQELEKKREEEEKLREEECATPEPPRIVPIGRGRAAMLHTVSQAAATPEPPSECSINVPSTSAASTGSGPTIPMGRGSSILYKTKASSDSRTSNTSGETAGIGGKMSSMSLDESQASTPSTTESEPVVMRGQCGDPVHLSANYIFVNLAKDKGMYQYEVKFQPDIDSRSIRYKLLIQHTNVIGTTKTFDGSLLYLPIKLHETKTTLVSKHPFDNSNVVLHIIFKKKQLMKENISFFNVLMNRVLRGLSLVRIGRHDFNPSEGATHKIPQYRLEVWPGYITSINELEGGLQLNIDAAHRVMRLDTIRDFMTEMYNKDKNRFKELIHQEIVGCTVLTRYNNKTYKVDDIDWTKNPCHEFECKGENVTLVEYYKRHYAIEIKDLKQPLLLHIQKKKNTNGETVEQRVLLVPELCFLSGLNDTIRKDFKIMKELAARTQLKPQERREIIRDLISQIKKNDEIHKILKEWGLELADDTVNITGRILPKEEVEFGRGMKAIPNNASWAREATTKPMFRSPNLLDWGVVCTERDRRLCEDFVATMFKVAKNIGMQMNDPIKKFVRNDRIESYTEELKKIIRPPLKMVVIIFPTLRQDKYSAVKKLCCTDQVIPSQVIIAKTLQRPDKLKSVTEKIALQINCKLGGALWALKNPISNIMVVGIDVYHAGTGPIGKGSVGSVAGFVASLDRQLTLWHSRVCIQGPRQEMVDLLSNCFQTALNTFKNANGCYPDKIFVYRDGVGDGQLEQVKNFEVTQFLRACSAIETGYRPKMAVVIVQKRVNTRIFERRNNSLVNPGPGTVVDSVITRRNYYDFYLVPQQVNQGTVTPTHYIVLHDDAETKVDHMQRFTYKLCHLYYNWPGTIRVPAPCQYAHKLAYLIGQSVKTSPSRDLENKLYYL